MRAAKYSGQYSWNAHGPARMMCAYTGIYLVGTMIRFIPRQRRMWQSKISKYQSLFEMQLIGRERWNRLRGIKVA